jgi:hypothetical protein
MAVRRIAHPSGASVMASSPVDRDERTSIKAKYRHFWRFLRALKLAHIEPHQGSRSSI